MSLILGIECSCDDAAVALVEDGKQVHAEAIASLADDFAAWGGVVPEIAARGHVAAFPGLLDDLFTQQDEFKPSDVDAVAISAWPGLIGSLHCGMVAAKVFAEHHNIPLIAADHIRAHLAAAQLEFDEILYPFVGLVASGGHSHYYYCAGPTKRELLGGTIDDAAGEAFDKAAAVLDLGYPGGPLIDKLAKIGNPRALALPRSFIKDDTIRLSFAGLKTSLLYKVRGYQGKDPLTLDEQGFADAAASYQAAIIDCLIAKLRLAAEQRQCQNVVLGGGVACNSALRLAAAALVDDGFNVFHPSPRFCTDNGAMIAAAAHWDFVAENFAERDVGPLPTGKAGPRVMTKN